MCAPSSSGCAAMKGLGENNEALFFALVSYFSHIVYHYKTDIKRGASQYLKKQ
jgi:hypothetical protein